MLPLICRASEAVGVPFEIELDLMGSCMQARPKVHTDIYIACHIAASAPYNDIDSEMMDSNIMKLIAMLKAMKEDPSHESVRVFSEFLYQNRMGGVGYSDIDPEVYDRADDTSGMLSGREMYDLLSESADATAAFSDVSLSASSSVFERYKDQMEAAQVITQWSEGDNVR